ncbi:MAG: phosphatidylcholine/phosphatidylserine synthase [Phycisphaerae bacterium]|nr:phosphatidylcholine/phosphatidylserine synthase [Phycisphaerae bacterium]
MSGRHRRMMDDKPRRPLFRRVRRHRVKYVTLLPSLVTLLNGILGFTAIVLASKAHEPTAGKMSCFALAGYVIVLAMVADMLDGRLARMSQSTSSFGGQLDSLCDLVSFGAAPAFIMLRLVENELQLHEIFWGGLIHRFIWLAALVYFSCAAIRLARFNVENDENEVSHMSFAGLPSPAAAGVVVSLIIFQQEQVPTLSLLVYALPLATLGVGVLMVSRLRYPHIVNVYLKGRQPFDYLIRLLLLLSLVCFSSVQTAMVLIFGYFAAGSFVRWLYGRIFPRTRAIPLPSQEPAADGTSHVST